MLIRSIVTLLALWFAVYLLPVYGQGQALNLPSNVPLQYTPLPIPCRAVDTRVPSQNNNGPILAGTTQEFYPAGGGCNIPLPNFGFIVYAMNVTVIPHGPLGYLTVWAAGATQPLVSTFEFRGRERKSKRAALVAGTAYSLVVPRVSNLRQGPTLIMVRLTYTPATRPILFSM